MGPPPGAIATVTFLDEAADCARFTAPEMLATLLLPVFVVLGDFVGPIGAADFCTAPAGVVMDFDFDVSAAVWVFFVVVVLAGVRFVVVGSGLATTSSTTAETFTRLASITIGAVAGGSGAMLSAVTGVLTVTCSMVLASTPITRHGVVEEVAVFV